MLPLHQCESRSIAVRVLAALGLAWLLARGGPAAAARLPASAPVPSAARFT